MKFSIVVPVYNVAPYLHGCLDSVCSQTFFDWECICVDDGSVDGSAEILDAYQRNDRNRFRVIHQKNAGVSAARNAALDVATGEYVVFVDGDDGLVGNALEALDQLLSKDPVDIVMYGHWSVPSLEKRVDLLGETQMRVFDMENKQEARSAYHLIAGALIAWNGCYRRELLAETRFKPMPNGEDVVFGLESFCRARRVMLTDARLYCYVNRVGSAARTLNLRHMKSALQAVEWESAITRGWCQYEVVKDLYVKKIRASMLGCVFPLLFEVSKEERLNAKMLFFETLKKVAWDWKSRFVANLGGTFSLIMLLIWPFKIRTWLCRILNQLGSLLW